MTEGNNASGISSRPDRGITALRGNSFGAVVMLVIQFVLGTTVNLYGQLPATGDSKGLLSAFLTAITGGPLSLTLHALLGTLLVLASVAAVVRAARLGKTPLVVITTVGLIAILLAWISGARYVGSGGNDASLTMALATGVAILCYTTIIFITRPAAPEPSG